MHPLHLVSYFVGGALMANAVPHLAAGQMGQGFPSPFATPPGKGLSPARVNVLWGFANLVGAYFLVGRVGQFDFRAPADIVPLAVGVLSLGLMNASHFGRLNDGRGPLVR